MSVVAIVKELESTVSRNGEMNQAEVFDAIGPFEHEKDALAMIDELGLDKHWQIDIIDVVSPADALAHFVTVLPE